MDAKTNWLQAGTEPTWLQLEALIPLELSVAPIDAHRITNLSADTIIRLYPDYIVRPSPRRLTIKMKTALAISDGSLKPKTKTKT